MYSELLEIIIIGTGSYVCGKSKTEFGTILPSLLVYAKKYKINLDITVACNSSKGKQRILEKFYSLKSIMLVGDYVNLNTICCDGDPNVFFNTFSSKSKKIASIVSVPDQFHYYWIKSLLNKKIPVLTVKPLTLNLKDSLELKNISEELNTPAFVEFHKRYDKQIRYTRDQYLSNKLGNLLYTFTEYTQRKIIPTETFKDWSSKTNIFSYLGVHYVDAIYFITNAKPIKVMATGQKSFLKSSGIDTFDSIQCNITWKTDNGLLFNQTIMCSWVESNFSTAMSAQNLNLIFSNGRISCEQKDRGLSILRDECGLEHVNPDFSRQYSQEDFVTFEGYGVDAYINFLHLICEDNLLINDRRLCTINEGCISTSVIESANISLKNESNWVYIEGL